MKPRCPLPAPSNICTPHLWLFDDLPAMDDAMTRRGRPTLHVVFGEDMAMLAALALLNESYGIFGDLPALLPMAVREIGARGMIGGQAADVRGSREHSRVEKTTALTRLAMAAGAAAAGADSRDTEVLIRFGDVIGEVYQICDDIVDAVATDSESGKTNGQDRRHSRCSLMTQLGDRAACERVRMLVDGAVERLRIHFGNCPQTMLLHEFAQSIVARGLKMVEYDPSHAAAGLRSSGRMERSSLAGSSRP